MVTHWVEMLRIDPEDRFIHGILAKLFSTTSKQLKELSAGSFIYAGLFLTEGVGLLLQKHWAEYLTVITTSTLIPLEVYELAKHFSTAKLAILAVNVVIVWYSDLQNSCAKTRATDDPVSANVPVRFHPRAYALGL